MGVFTLGLDLGQAADYSALVVVESEADRYDVRDIHRWPLRTPYPAIVADVRGRLHMPPLAGAALIVDATGVGRPVVDMFATQNVYCTPVMITAGAQASRDADGYEYVPKRELVSTVQVMLQSQRLKIARALPEAATLAQELLSFQTKITAAANETYGSWREGTHDDLVLALALALWHAERNAGSLVLWGDDDG